MTWTATAGTRWRAARSGPDRAAVAGPGVVSLTVLTAAVAAALVVAHARAGRGGLPVSWCRWRPGQAVLPPLADWRLLTAWQLDAVAVSAVTALAGGYLAGVRRVRRGHPAQSWPKARTAAFFGGLAVVVLSTCSSIGVYDMTLFSVHMAQHLALIMVAPPLLAAGRPLTLALHATGEPWHSRIERAARCGPVTALTCPPVAYGAYAVTIVGTHLTGLMGAVMRRAWLGQAEHLLYLVAGYLFFVLVFGDEPIRWRLSMPARLLLVVLSMAVDTFVGLVLMQSSQAVDMLPHPGWGSSALVDTQTGGAIMWFFGDGIMAVLVVLLGSAWSRRPEHLRPAGGGWLELSRQETLAAHTGYRPGTATRRAAAGTGSPADAGAAAPHTAGGRTDLDEDDDALAAYNAWLARLAGPAAASDGNAS